MSDIPDEFFLAADEAMLAGHNGCKLPNANSKGCNCDRSLITGCMSRRHAIARALMAERERDRWMPIETAPRDGTQILVGHEHAAFSAYWSASSSAWVTGEKDLYDEFVEYHPTHWQPLPAPPPAIRKGAP